MSQLLKLLLLLLLLLQLVVHCTYSCCLIESLFIFRISFFCSTDFKTSIKMKSCATLECHKKRQNVTKTTSFSTQTITREAIIRTGLICRLCMVLEKTSYCGGGRVESHSMTCDAWGNSC